MFVYCEIMGRTRTAIIDDETPIGMLKQAVQSKLCTRLEPYNIRFDRYMPSWDFDYEDDYDLEYNDYLNHSDSYDSYDDFLPSYDYDAFDKIMGRDEAWEYRPELDKQDFHDQAVTLMRSKSLYMQRRIGANCFGRRILNRHARRSLGRIQRFARKSERRQSKAYLSKLLCA